MNSKVVRESTPLGNQRSERHTSEPTPGNRGRSHHNLRGHVRRAEVLISPPDREKNGGSGVNSFGASFSIWGTVW